MLNAKLRFFACLLAVNALCVDALMAAQDIQQRLQVLDMRLNIFVRSLSNLFKARIELSDGVRGRIRHESFQGSLDDILDKVNTNYGTEWFRFNNVYYVSMRAENTTRVIRLGKLSPDRVLSILDESGLLSPALQTLVTLEGDAIALTGPRQMVAFAEAVIEGIPELPEPPGVAPIRIRRAGKLESDGGS